MSLVPVEVPSVAIPDSREVAQALPNHVLYRLELAGQIAREVLDERVVAWTHEGRSQSDIAQELGCTRQAISKRQQRLGVEAANPNMARLRNPVAQNGRKEPTPPQRPTQYLPDLLHEDSPRNLRTQIVRWCELGRHIESLLNNRADLEPKSEEDLRLIRAEVVAMSQLAKRLERSISDGKQDTH